MGEKGLDEKHDAFKTALASGKTADAKAASTALQLIRARDLELELRS